MSNPKKARARAGKWSRELPEVAKRASERYADNTELRVLVNLVPYIGSSIDLIFASEGSKMIQKRIEALLENLKIEISLVKEEKIDREYLFSEEFFDIILKVFEASTKTRDREKIRWYARLLRGSVVIQDRSRFFPDDYLNALTELTPTELEVAKAIYEQQGNSRPQSNENSAMGS